MSMLGFDMPLNRRVGIVGFLSQLEYIHILELLHRISGDDVTLVVAARHSKEIAMQTLQKSHDFDPDYI